MGSDGSELHCWSPSCGGLQGQAVADCLLLDGKGTEFPLCGTEKKA